MMSIVHYKISPKSKLTYQTYKIFFSPRFARITVHIIANFMWDDLDEMIDVKR